MPSGLIWGSIWGVDFWQLLGGMVLTNQATYHQKYVSKKALFDVLTCTIYRKLLAKGEIQTHTSIDYSRCASIVNCVLKALLLVAKHFLCAGMRNIL